MITVSAILLQEDNEPKEFLVEVTNKNYIIIRKRLELEREKIVEYFKELRRSRDIKSIWKPKNKKIQSKLDNLIKAKHTLTKSISQIKEMYYK